MKISVAAVPYFWSKETYIKFYKALAKSPADIIYLGETVCSKRRSMRYEDWLEIAQLLVDAGKEVVLSTLTLLEANSELSYLSKIASQELYLIEANDSAAIQVASQEDNPFVAGCAINIYNNRTLSFYQGLGMRRWCVPVELGKEDISPMLNQIKLANTEVEYQVFGRMPLAYSARCFTARHHQKPKDNCQFICLEDEQGILVKTQEGDSFAQINGIQTQSAKVSNLLNHWADLRQSGVDILRIVPVGVNDTLEVVSQLGELIKGEQTCLNTSQLQGDYEYCNGYWFQLEGMKFVS